jgi:hypothetical protein
MFSHACLLISMVGDTWQKVVHDTEENDHVAYRSHDVSCLCRTRPKTPRARQPAGGTFGSIR